MPVEPSAEQWATGTFAPARGGFNRCRCSKRLNCRSLYYAAEDLGYVTAKAAAQRRQRARQISEEIASLTPRLRPSRRRQSR